MQIGFERLVDSVQILADHTRVLCGGTCGCPEGFHRVRRNPSTLRLECNCIGFHRWGHREDFACKHINARHLRLALRVLEITGEPNAELLAHAISDIESNTPLLRSRYFADGGDAPHYGFAPNRRAPVRASIGLTLECRARDLTPDEREASTWALSRWMEEAKVKAA